MNTQTPDYFTICSSCNMICMSLFNGYDFKSQKYILRCQKCTFSQSVKGAGCYKPCSKCIPPHINWYYCATFGDIKKDCGHHEPPEIPLPNIFD